MGGAKITSIFVLKNPFQVHIMCHLIGNLSFTIQIALYSLLSLLNLKEGTKAWKTINDEKRGKQ